jgi:hypothetical protein
MATNSDSVIALMVTGNLHKVHRCIFDIKDNNFLDMITVARLAELKILFNDFKFFCPIEKIQDSFGLTLARDKSYSKNNYSQLIRMIIEYLHKITSLEFDVNHNDIKYSLIKKIEVTSLIFYNNIKTNINVFLKMICASLKKADQLVTDIKSMINMYPMYCFEKNIAFVPLEIIAKMETLHYENPDVFSSFNPNKLYNDAFNKNKLYPTQHIMYFYDMNLIYMVDHLLKGLPSRTGVETFWCQINLSNGIWNVFDKINLSSIDREMIEIVEQV